MSGKPDPDERSDDGGSVVDFGDVIDQTTFEQILEMDDEDSDREFSRGIVFGFFDQAETTFTQMENALSNGDLDELSRLGHFLKGSSATLGLTKVKDACEKIQHFGQRKDENGSDVSWDDKKLLDKSKVEVALTIKEYAEVEKRLRAFYGSS